MVYLDGILLTVNAIGNPLKAKSNAQGNPFPFFAPPGNPASGHSYSAQAGISS
jgi:hypothetical protein